MSLAPTPKPLPIKSFAAEIGCSENAVRNWIKNTNPPHDFTIIKNALSRTIHNIDNPEISDLLLRLAKSFAEFKKSGRNSTTVETIGNFQPHLQAHFCGRSLEVQKL